jgi:hypothetical protein
MNYLPCWRTTNLQISIYIFSFHLSWYSNWLQAGRSGFNSQQRLGVFLFNTMSRLALGPTQPPSQWVLETLSQGTKWLGHESDHSPSYSANVKECVEQYLHFPNTSSWHDAYLNTGTSLPLPFSIKISFNF